MSAINFSRISNQTFFGQLLRFPLKFIPLPMKMPILQGKLRGKQWIVKSSVHGCWIGSYEYDMQILFEKTISEGKVVFDIGAHVGFYTLLASELVCSKGRVFAFEPMPRNLFYLQEHLRLNHITNVTVIEAAISDSSGLANFEETANPYQGHLSAQGTIQVKIVNLDQMIALGEIVIPDYLKIDVEGAEMQVLLGAKNILEKAHPTIFLATHGDVLQKQCREFLTLLGYQLKPTSKKNIEQADEIIAYYDK